MKLYNELAEWWPLFSPPKDYAEEAATYHEYLRDATQPPPRTLLELGSGGGNNASFLKAHYAMTLTDLSPAMLAVSRTLNPECEHIQGDMRTLRLGRMFDAVFAHDAIDYMTTEEDLTAVVTTAYIHCSPGGAALFAPDYVREQFASNTEVGGEDGDGRSVRYLEWITDPDLSDTTYVADYAILLRDELDATPRVVHDHHVGGLFPRDTWLRLLTDVGFQPRIVPGDGGRDMFLATRDGGGASASNARRDL